MAQTTKTPKQNNKTKKPAANTAKPEATAVVEKSRLRKLIESSVRKERDPKDEWLRAVKIDKDYLKQINSICRQTCDQMFGIIHAYYSSDSTPKTKRENLYQYTWAFQRSYYNSEWYPWIDVCRAKYWLDLFLQEIPMEYQQEIDVDSFNALVPNREKCLLECEEIKQEYNKWYKSSDRYIINQSGDKVCLSGEFQHPVTSKCWECHVDHNQPLVAPYNPKQKVCALKEQIEKQDKSLNLCDIIKTTCAKCKGQR